MGEGVAVQALEVSRGETSPRQRFQGGQDLLNLLPVVALLELVFLKVTHSRELELTDHPACSSLLHRCALARYPAGAGAELSMKGVQLRLPD